MVLLSPFPDDTGEAVACKGQSRDVNTRPFSSCLCSLVAGFRRSAPSFPPSAEPQAGEKGF